MSICLISLSRVNIEGIHGRIFAAPVVCVSA
jgi:hypothetical protein